MDNCDREWDMIKKARADTPKLDEELQELLECAQEIAEKTRWILIGIAPGASFKMKCGEYANFSSYESVFEFRDMLRLVGVVA